MLFPVQNKDLNKCRFTSPYGGRIHPITKKVDGHRGVDIAMPTGTQLVALEDGVVTVNKVNNGGHTKGLGYYLIIKYDNGYFSLYAHLKELSTVKVGTRVKQGQVVATSGNTGSSTGSHLHFELHKGNLLFKSQVKDKDTAINPTIVYPELQNYLGKYLTGINFKGVDNVTKPIVNKSVDNTPSDWAKESWDWAIKNGITDGTRPKDIATREEVIKLIYSAKKVK